MNTDAQIPAKIEAARTRMGELDQLDREAEGQLERLDTQTKKLVAQAQEQANAIMQQRNQWGVEHQRQQERIVALDEVLALLNTPENEQSAAAPEAPAAQALAVVPPLESEEAIGN